MCAFQFTDVIIFNKYFLQIKKDPKKVLTIEVDS